MAVHAEQALPPEAYGPIPDDAADDGVSNIPITELFVGRDTALDQLDAALATPGGVVLRAVSGLGGVGKSTLAAHWVDHRATARLRWWITADSVTAVDTGLAELARALQPGLAGLPVELQKERAVAWLAGHGDWLLVLDNVDHPDHIGPLLDRVRDRGRILVTTRRATGWHRLTTTLRLDVFDPAESVELFTRILTHDGPRETDGAREVCEELGHLALAVEQAAAFCHESGTTPRAYLDMLRQGPAETYALGPAHADSERTVARIWRITLDRLADMPLAGQVLRILAWYAPDHIPRTLLDGLASPPALAAAIGRLAAYSMITKSPDGTLSVHRLVQALARTPQDDDPHRQESDITHACQEATGRLRNAFPTDVVSPERWPQCQALLPHADALAERSNPEHDVLDLSYLLDRVATFRQDQGAIAGAITYFLRALAIAQRVLGEDHPNTLASRNNLAGAYRSAGDLTRAVPLLEQTLADSIRVLGEDHPNTLTSRNNLAGAYESAGDLTRAVPLYEQTLADRVRVLGEDHPDTLISRDNLAGAYESAGDLTRAVPLFEQTLADRVRVLGEDHPNTLTSRDNLAGAYRSAGDLTRAVPLLEQTLADRVRVLGEDHPDTLTSRNNLAGAYESAGDLTRAVPLLEQTLADSIRVLGEDHPDTLISRNNLAGAYESAGDLTRAIPLYEQTLADRVRVLGEDHPRTLTSRNNLAGAYESAGDLTRAVPLYEQTLADCVRVLGEDHPNTLISRNNLAGVYESAGDLTRAVPLLEQTLADCERVLGRKHPLTRTVWSNLEAAGGV
ncbi:tetratricopeptide repeat protein [Streptomyces flaveus]|uniref:tetratricopeptide repeat protein n=1 Tax=Streptomyces flaveus TaxID=66370 RepID=UPI001BC99009|nr:tetratricopeptide repeat protein [Streptomyces flaveus]